MRITLVQPEKLPNDHALLAPKKMGGNFGLHLAQNHLLVLLVSSARILRTRPDVRPGARGANPLTFFTLIPAVVVGTTRHPAFTCPATLSLICSHVFALSPL